MKVISIEPGNKKQERDFIKLPYLIYPSNSLWVPPLESELRLALHRQKHPFYQHSDATFILAYADGQPVGRLTAIHHRPYCHHHQRNAGFFYYFECIDNQEVADNLFQSAENWLREKGLHEAIGPKGLLRSNGQGILVEGFEHPPAVGIAYNPPYYDRLFTNAGYQRWTDHLSGYIERTHQLPVALYQVAEKVKQHGKFWVRSFKTLAELRPFVNELNAVHQQAFADNPNYIPSTPDEFALMAENILAIAEPDMLKIIMRGDEIAGFIITYPDITKALRRIKGKLWPLGWIDVLFEKKRTDVINGNGVGILPKYQGMGANALLYCELEKTLRAKTQYRVLDLVQVDERNAKSMADMQFVGVNWIKRHRTYHKRLTEEDGHA